MIFFAGRPNHRNRLSPRAYISTHFVRGTAMRACTLRTAFACAARGRVSGPGPRLRPATGARASANDLGFNDNTGNASRTGPR
jgi:hypothetical protein